MRRRLIPLSLAIAVLLMAGCSKKTRIARFLGSAQHYRQEGKLQEASIQFRNALKLNPNLVEARLGLADVLLAQGDVIDAEPELRKCLAQDPSNVHVLTTLGGIYLKAGKLDWAKEKTEVALRIDPGNIDAKLLSGQIQLACKQPQAAERIFRDALSKENNPRAWLGIAAAQSAQDNLTATEESLRQAVAASHRSASTLLTLAKFLEEHDKSAEAQQLWEEAANKDKNNLDVLVPMAAFYKRQGNLAQSEAVLVRVRDLAPKTSPFRTLLANYYLITGEAPKAKQELESLARTDGLDSPAAARLGDLLIDDKEMQEAQALIDKILAKNKKSALGAYLKGRMDLVHGDGIDAAQQFDEATHYMTRTPRLYYYKGLAYLAQNKAEDAKASFSHALEVDPGYYDALLQRAKISLASGDKKGALADAIRLLRVHQTTDSITLYVQVLMAYGEMKQAEELLTTLIHKQQPGKARASLLSDAAIVSMQQKNFPEAHGQLEQARVEAPESMVPSQLLATLYLMQDKVAEAERSIADAQTQYPNSVDLKLMLGDVYLRERRFPQAAELYRQLLAADPQNTTAQFGLAKVALAQQDWGTAASIFEKLGRDHQAADALVNAGQAREKIGQVDLARQDYEQGLKLNPNSAIGLNNVSWIYLNQGLNTDVALGYAQRAKELMPDSPQVADTLAWAFYHKNRYEFALDQLQFAVNKQPDRALYHYHLAECYAALGHRSDAKQEFERALRGSGDFPRQDVARQMQMLESSR